MASILCRTRYFRPGRFEEMNETINGYKVERMLWKLDKHPVYAIPNQHPTRWMFSKKLVFKPSLLLNGQCGIQVHPPTNNDDLCLLFSLYPSSMGGEETCCWELVGCYWSDCIPLQLIGYNPGTAFPSEPLPSHLVLNFNCRWQGRTTSILETFYKFAQLAR